MLATPIGHTKVQPSLTEENTMKTIIIVLSLFVNGSAWAEWVSTGFNDRVRFYVDPSTIRTDGNFRKVWQLQDSKQQNKEGELSYRHRSEYDCKQERHRFLSLSAHNSSMAEGDILRSSASPTPWEDIPPGSVAEDTLKMICGSN